MTWIKICGITNLDDAMTAVDAGADAVGFVFYEKSPRKIDVETASEIVSKLPERVEKVGVFVDHDSGAVRDAIKRARLTAVQLYGRILAELVKDPTRAPSWTMGAKVIPAIPGDDLKDGFTGSDSIKNRMFAILLDAGSNGSAGGTGTAFDWQAARGMVQAISLTIPVIIAGGLTSTNVNEAIRLFQPFGADVASGVELSPGKKDREKVRAFIDAVRAEDKRN
ncbi:MAG TPA: phosphoribosylanthranilate isomerase [Terriglobales bacterium]